MKLQCPRSLLAAAISTVAVVVPSRTPKEILRNIKLVVGGGKATLIGTDQEVGIRYEIPEIETTSAGEVLLPTARISAILREVQDDTISLEVTEEALWVRTSQSEFRLSVENPAEFPDVAAFNEENYHVIPGRSLKQGIQRTLFAADVESTRYALGGVLMELRPTSMTLAATDSRRLAVFKAPSSAQGRVSEEVGTPVIPSKAMQLIEKSIQDLEKDVHIAIHNNDVLVRSGHSTIYARLVEGRFPRYQDVIPSSFEMQIPLVVGPFLSSVRQAMIVQSEESKGVDFVFENGTLTLKSTASDIGTSRIQLPISFDGAKIDITFDPKYVADFLRVLDPAGQTTLNLIDQNSAAVFKSEENYTYVVMPLAKD
jgi:DNA polymerase-3 subunit beta